MSTDKMDLLARASFKRRLVFIEHLLGRKAKQAK